MSGCSTLSDFKMDQWVVVMSSITKLEIFHLTVLATIDVLSGPIISLGVVRS